MQKAKAFRPMLTRSRKTGNQSTVGKKKAVRLPRTPHSTSQVIRLFPSLDRGGPLLPGEDGEKVSGGRQKYPAGEGWELQKGRGARS